MIGNFVESPVTTIPVRTFWGVPVIVLFVGILVSNNLRLLSRGLRIFQKPYSKQIIYFLLITIFCAVIFSPAIYTFVTLLQLDFYLNDEIKKRMTFFAKIIPAIFQGILAFFIWNLIYFLYYYIQNIKAKEREKGMHEKQLLELESKALRSQMNPHFIFNCMNSIKALIQWDEKDKAINYLTTFSKLMRTILNNSDKKEINLIDEIETCRLYAQLESMRFGNKLLERMGLK